jgi:hypothetical protein
MKKTLIAFLVFTFSFAVYAQPKVWPEKKANDWYAQQGWLVGCDFLPSTAINQ